MFVLFQRPHHVQIAGGLGKLHFHRRRAGDGDEIQRLGQVKMVKAGGRTGADWWSPGILGVTSRSTSACMRTKATMVSLQNRCQSEHQRGVVVGGAFIGMGTWFQALTTWPQWRSPAVRSGPPRFRI